MLNAGNRHISRTSIALAASTNARERARNRKRPSDQNLGDPPAGEPLLRELCTGRARTEANGQNTDSSSSCDIRISHTRSSGDMRPWSRILRQRLRTVLTM
jgi:hypothetical protein